MIHALEQSCTQWLSVGISWAERGQQDVLDICMQLAQPVIVGVVLLLLVNTARTDAGVAVLWFGRILTKNQPKKTLGILGDLGDTNI